MFSWSSTNHHLWIHDPFPKNCPKRDVHDLTRWFAIISPMLQCFVPKKNKETHCQGRLNGEPPLRCKELRAVFTVIPVALTPSSIIPCNLQAERLNPGYWGGDYILGALGVSWRHWVLKDTTKLFQGIFKNILVLSRFEIVVQYCLYLFLAVTGYHRLESWQI